MCLWSSPLFSGSSPPLFHLSQPSVTPPARDAHPVSYSFLFPVDRKSTDTQTVESQQEVISLQHLQPGNRTGPSREVEEQAVNTHTTPPPTTHTQTHIYKQVPQPQTPSDFPYSCWHWNHNTGNGVRAAFSHANKSVPLCSDIIIIIICINWCIQMKHRVVFSPLL